MINNLEAEKSLKSKTTKKENCFSIPELSKKDLKLQEQTEKNNLMQLHTVCPVENHKLKLKEIIKVNFINYDSGKVLCSICLSEISYQKVLLIKQCGDILCVKCYDSLYKLGKNKETLLNTIEHEETNTQLCGTCNLPFTDVVNLQEAYTGYSSHNKIEKNYFMPYFKC